MSIEPIPSAAWERAGALVLAADRRLLDDAESAEVARAWREIVAPLPAAPATSPWIGEAAAEVAAFLERYAGATDTPNCAAEFLGLAEWVLFRALYESPWGGPFNGQRRRRELFEELHRAGRFHAVVETGTFRGETTEWLARHADRPVVTIEASPRFHRFAQQRLARRSNARVVLGDSRRELANLAANASFPKENVLFYLDAHWGDDLPIADELATIGGAWRRSVVVVDDFQVPHDPGFGWDDYANAGRLCLEAVSFEALAPGLLFWPSAASSEETGSRRGCLVAAMDGVLSSPDTLSTLRPFRRI